MTSPNNSPHRHGIRVNQASPPFRASSPLAYGCSNSEKPYVGALTLRENAVL